MKEDEAISKKNERKRERYFLTVEDESKNQRR
jgi:hypothetical protein